MYVLMNLVYHSTLWVINTCPLGPEKKINIYHYTLLTNTYISASVHSQIHQCPHQASSNVVF